MEDDIELRAQVETLMAAAQDLTVRLEEDPRGKAVLRQYMKFLFSEKPRSYTDLAAFLEWYGTKFLLKDILYVLEGTLYDQIVELGPGTGWLLVQLATHSNGTRIAIDKRTALFQRKAGIKFIGHDMELGPDLKLSPSPLKTLIVANQFLHCVNNASQIVGLNRADWLVVELLSYQWRHQIRAFGADPLSPAQVESLFRVNGYRQLTRRRSGPVEITFWRPV